MSAIRVPQAAAGLRSVSRLGFVPVASISTVPNPSTVNGLLKEASRQLESGVVSSGSLLKHLGDIVNSAQRWRSASERTSTQQREDKIAASAQIGCDSLSWNGISAGVARDKHTVDLLSSLSTQLKGDMCTLTPADLPTAHSSLRPADLALVAELCAPFFLRADAYLASTVASTDGSTAPTVSPTSLSRAQATAAACTDLLRTATVQCTTQLQVAAHGQSQLHGWSLRDVSRLFHSLVTTGTTDDRLVQAVCATAYSQWHAHTYAQDAQAALQLAYDLSVFASITPGCPSYSEQDVLTTIHTILSGVFSRSSSSTLASAAEQGAHATMEHNTAHVASNPLVFGCIAYLHSRGMSPTVRQSRSLCLSLVKCAALEVYTGSGTMDACTTVLASLPPKPLLALLNLLLDVFSSAVNECREGSTPSPSLHAVATLSSLCLGLLANRLQLYEAGYMQAVLGGQLAQDVRAVCSSTGVEGYKPASIFHLLQTCMEGLPPEDDAAGQFADRARVSCRKHSRAFSGLQALELLRSMRMPVQARSSEPCVPPARSSHYARSSGHEDEPVLPATIAPWYSSPWLPLPARQWMHVRHCPRDLTVLASTAASFLRLSSSLSMRPSAVSHTQDGALLLTGISEPIALLQQAATDVLFYAADTAVVHALSGESSAEEELSIADSILTSGVSHRAVFTMLARRTVARATVKPSALTPLTEDTLARILSCLSLAWEWDEDAFAVVGAELQRRKGLREGAEQGKKEQGSFFRRLLGEDATTMVAAPEWGWIQGLSATRPCAVEIPWHGGDGISLSRMTAAGLVAGSPFGSRQATTLLPLLHAHGVSSSASTVDGAGSTSGVPKVVWQGDMGAREVARECAGSAQDVRKALHAIAAMLELHVWPIHRILRHSSGKGQRGCSVGYESGSDSEGSSHGEEGAQADRLIIGAEDGIKFWEWVDVSTASLLPSTHPDVPVPSVSVPIALPAHKVLVDLIPTSAAVLPPMPLRELLQRAHTNAALPETMDSAVEDVAEHYLPPQAVGRQRGRASYPHHGTGGKGRQQDVSSDVPYPSLLDGRVLPSGLPALPPYMSSLLCGTAPRPFLLHPSLQAMWRCAVLHSAVGWTVVQVPLQLALRAKAQQWHVRAFKLADIVTRQGRSVQSMPLDPLERSLLQQLPLSLLTPLSRARLKAGV